LKPKQPVQRVGYFPEQPAQPQAKPERRRRADKPNADQPHSQAKSAQPLFRFPQEHGEQPCQQSRQQPYVQHPNQTNGSYTFDASRQVPYQNQYPNPAAAGREGTARPVMSGAKAERKSAPLPPLTPRQLLMRRLLLIVCMVVFAVSAFLLIRYFVNIAITRKASRELEQVYSAAVESVETPEPTPVATETPVVATTARASRPTPTPVATQAAAPSADQLWPRKYPGNPTLRVSTVFYELQRQNADIIGWLKIDGVLEEAVVQRDNEYYLTHNALKQRSVTGALFLDENCDLRTVPTQMLIHGHNMKEGAMFGSLKKYKVKDASFYRQHPFIDFNTVYENGRYVIFAVAEVDLRWNKGDYLPFWQDVRFSSAEDFESYVKKARDLSHYHCNVDVEPGDRLLTLSTCTGSDDNKRLIVMARKLRENENELQLNMSIMSTYDR